MTNKVETPTVKKEHSKLDFVFASTIAALFYFWIYPLVLDCMHLSWVKEHFESNELNWPIFLSAVVLFFLLHITQAILYTKHKILSVRYISPGLWMAFMSSAAAFVFYQNVTILTKYDAVVDDVKDSIEVTENQLNTRDTHALALNVSPMERHELASLGVDLKDSYCVNEEIDSPDELLIYCHGRAEFYRVYLQILFGTYMDTPFEGSESVAKQVIQTVSDYDINNYPVKLVPRNSFDSSVLEYRLEQLKASVDENLAESKSRIIVLILGSLVLTILTIFVYGHLLEKIKRLSIKPTTKKNLEQSEE